MPNTQNNSTPSNSPFLNKDITQRLVGSDLSLQSLRLLKSTNKFLNEIAGEEILKRKKLAKEHLKKYYIDSEIIIQASNENPDLAQDMIELCNYPTLFKTKIELKEADKLKTKIDTEISRRDILIATFLEENMIENPLDGIAIAINQKKNKTASNLIGKYLHKEEALTATNRQHWSDSRNFFSRKLDNNNTILHLVAQTNDPELVISICWSFNKAFAGQFGRHNFFMNQNDDGDNPIHHAFRYDSHKSALTLAKGMSSLEPDDVEKLIYPQTNRQGLTTKECLYRSKELLNQPSTPDTVKKPSAARR